MEITKEIVTPIEGKVVVIKTILTGAEREQVQSAQMRFVKTKDGKEFEVTDMSKVALAEKHEILKISVLSIDGDAVNCFERLQKMFEPDYEFVYSQVLEAQKKMMVSTSPQS